MMVWFTTSQFPDRRARPRSFTVAIHAEFLGSIQAIKIEKRGLLLRSFLFEISWEESAAGRGMLTALIVTKTGSGPDAVLAHLAESLGLQIRDIDAFWIQEMDRVFESWADTEHASVARAPTSEYMPPAAESKPRISEYKPPAASEAESPTGVQTASTE